jgi:copper chaperone CopZ
MEKTTNDRCFRMRVDGMTCPSCEHHLEKALSEAGARNEEADFRRGEAFLSMEGLPRDAVLAAAVRAAGYKPGQLEPVDVIAPRDGDLVEYRLPIDEMTAAHLRQLLLGLLPDPIGGFTNVAAGDQHDWHEHKGSQRQAPVEAQHQGECAHDSDDVGHKPKHGLGDDVLNAAHVVAHTRKQIP